MKHRIVAILLLTLLLCSCGEYQKLLKTTDPQLKYEKAIEYFNKNDFARAQTLFDDISTFYKGTERAEDVLNYLARCYVGNKDYLSASEYYQAYIRNYPKGRFIIESRFMVAHCYYLDSPDARLDQENTRKAIDFYTQFIELYPESPYVQRAYEEMNEMYDKLAQKELYSARLYYNLGTYLGDNYTSCVIVSKNALKKYPANAYAEEFSFLILQARYQLVVYSTDDKKMERAREATDEYYSFRSEFPNSKHQKTVEKIGTELRKITKE